VVVIPVALADLAVEGRMEQQDGANEERMQQQHDYPGMPPRLPPCTQIPSPWSGRHSDHGDETLTVTKSNRGRTARAVTLGLGQDSDVLVGIACPAAAGHPRRRTFSTRRGGRRCSVLSREAELREEEPEPGGVRAVIVGKPI
jgi:hypothetical protein